MLAAERDNRYTRQLFDDDLAELRLTALPRERRDSTPEREAANRPVLSVYPLHVAGMSRPDVPGTEQTGAVLANLHIRLPCEPASVPQARSRLGDWCRQAWIRGDVVADVQLAVTEAAANAVRHSACDEFEIQGWIRHAALIVSVSDQGPGRGDPEPGLGVGITVIRALADSVDFEDTHPGTRVTMRFPRLTYL